MGIEARSWDTNCTRPVIIVVALIVSDRPELILSETGTLISDDEELGAGDSSAGDVLSDKEELEMVGSNIS